MAELTFKTFVSGELFNNCYLMFDGISKKGFIIDRPASNGELEDFIEKNKIDISFIGLTHAHCDHIDGLANSSIPFYVHSEDAKFLKNPDLNGSRFFGTPFSIKKEPNIYDKSGILEFEDHKIKILHTPGHTPGSVSLLINNRLFSGDVLFSNSIGRTDFPLASHEQLISAIKEKILTLPDDTIVHPGHGLSTTVGREKEGNPFL